MIFLIFSAFLLVADLALFLTFAMRFSQNRSVRQYFAFSLATFVFLIANAIKLAASIVLYRETSPSSRLSVFLLVLVGFAMSFSMVANVISDMAVLTLFRQWIHSMREAHVPGQDKTSRAAKYTRYIYMLYPIVAFVCVVLLLIAMFVDSTVVEMIGIIIGGVYNLAALGQFGLVLWLWFAVRNVSTSELVVKRQQLIVLAFMSFFYAARIYALERPLEVFALAWYVRHISAAWKGAIVSISDAPRVTAMAQSAPIESFNIPPPPPAAFVKDIKQ